MHVDGEGGDEAEAEVVAQRPGVGVGAKVPADQRAVDGSVRQHRLGPRVKMVDVNRTAVLLKVQRPERKDADNDETRGHQDGGLPVGGGGSVTWSGTAALWGILAVCWLRLPAAGWIRYLMPPPSNVTPDRRSTSSRDRQYENKSTPTCRSTQQVNIRSRRTSEVCYR